MTIKKVLDNYLLNPMIYRYVNLVIFMVYFIPSALNIENIPMKISFVWGLGVIAYDFVTKRNMLKQPYWLILALLAASYLVSVVTNYPYQFPDTAINWGYLIISLFIFYAFDTKESKQSVDKKIRIFNDIFIYATLVLGLIAIVLFVFNISYRVPAGLGTFTLRQGFIGSRLFGVYTSPNIGSMFGYVSVVLMLVNNHFKRGTWTKFQTLYVINGIVQYIFFVLSKSRGTQITLVGLGFMLFSIAVLLKISKKRKLTSALKIWGLGVGLSLLVFFSVSRTVEETLSYVPSTIEVVKYEASNLFNNDNDTEVDPDQDPDSEVEEKPAPPTFSRVDLRSDEGGELSSGRFSIWMAGLQLVKQKPFFGVADTDIYRGIETTNQIDESQLSDLDISELQRASGNMHNTYVSVLAKSGIVGFTLLAVFVVLILKDNIVYMLSGNFNLKNPSDQLYLIIFVFLLSLFVNDVVENHLIMNNRDVIGLVFWTYLGYLNFVRSKLSADEELA
ncbi:O-antigen ligase family protein [Marinilactibacillus sp. XAAS-LB27]|uniref:O-antigen ligase family protein n=1 Tax=Marinilactibacillus sp. XAAS-LB27 TaxID=3114538 RepID=UPI002E171AE1|nr:O-antigen ligase family protein [Marinilactibacillus sp. XAAS-LB27]